VINPGTHTSNEIMKISSVVGRFVSSAALLEAANKMRLGGYTKFDCHSPFPIHGMDAAMGEKRSPLGFIVGVAALFGCVGAMGLQWWVHTTAYPLVISGKPFFSWQAFVPVTFELTVLCSAFAAVFGMFALNGMPRWYHALFASERFCGFSDDAFWISIEATDGKFDERRASEFLKSIGAAEVETIREAA